MLDAATESASSGIVTGTDRLLIIEGLTNTFDGVRYQLNGVDLTVCKGQKLGLVGINGCGKSTMLRIIGGKENSDKGNIETARNTRVVYVEQEPYFPPDITVMDAIYASDAPLMNILRDYQEASEAMAAYPNDKDAASRFEKSMALMEKEDAWDAEGRAHRIMQRLRVDKLKSQQVNRLSGGEKKRVALASALVQQPEVLLLDEPTNHLDMEAIDWLGDLLADKSLTFLLVTHDRWFLENVCQEILELDNGKIYRYPGSYGKYLEAKEERLRVEEQEYSNDKNKLRHEIEWVRKQPKARQAKSKSRVEAFFRLKSKVNSSNAANPMGGVTLQNYSARLGSFVLKFTDANLSFSKRILDDFSYEFHKGDRIGIVGANGVGKSTFLNVLTQQQMLDSGVVTVGETVRYGYYQQQGLINVNEEQRVLQLVEDVCAGVPKSPDDFAPKDPQTTARQLLKRFNFPASRWNDMVSRLSGGEKRRLQLLKILASSPNFLVLDEPTNDLDIPTLSVLEEFLLTEYKGCLIIVSHDRFFMERVAKKLFLFEGDGEILAFEGLFSDYLGHIRSVLKERERDEIADTSMAASMSNSTPMSNSTSNKSKLTYKQKKDYEGLEKEIEKCSKRQKELSELLNGSYKNGVDYVEVAKWSAEFSDLEKKINDKTEKWMEIAELVDG